MKWKHKTRVYLFGLMIGKFFRHIWRNMWYRWHQKNSVVEAGWRVGELTSGVGEKKLKMRMKQKIKSKNSNVEWIAGLARQASTMN